MSGLSLLKKAVFTLLLLPAVIYLSRVGVADYLRLEPCAYLNAVINGQVRLDPVELDKSRVRLQLAQSWDGSNPEIVEYLGQTNVMLAQLSAFIPELQASYLRKAIADFELAIQLRPNSSYLWAGRMTAGSMLLDACARTGGDPALLRVELPKIVHAMHRAAVLGPWEPQVLTQIVRVGRVRYEQLSPQARAMVDEANARAGKLGLNISLN